MNGFFNNLLVQLAAIVDGGMLHLKMLDDGSGIRYLAGREGIPAASA